MNNLAPMKNCPGGVQGNLNWMPGYDQNLTFLHFQVPFWVMMGLFFFLDASTQLFNKLMIITSYNMIKVGGVIQGEITRLVLRIRGVINYF